MSGLFDAVVRPLAQMGFADRVPNMHATSKRRWVPRVVPILGSTDCHLAAAALVGARLSLGKGSNGHRRAVDLAARHHRPQDAGYFVGERHGGELFGLARQQLEEPRRGSTRFGGADHRGGAEHQEAAQVLVALPADPARALAAGGGVLLWRGAEPGGEVACRAEPLGIAYLEGEAH